MSLMVQHPHERTRLQVMLRAGLVALGILTLIVLPGYLASMPGFFGRYKALDGQYEPWAVSTHAEAGCQTCHVPPEPLPRIVYRVRMVGEFYLSLVSRSTRTPGYFASPTNEACLECHSDLRSVSPKGDLQIPHRAHIGILKMRCVECHNYLVHELSPEGKHVPPMVECLECHDGRDAEDACTACHTAKAAPESHSAGDWQFTHAEAAKADGCEECHKWREDWCVDCHTDRPVSHAADWRAVHGDRVVEHRNCEACHTGDFCIRCHGELPQLNFDPALRLVE
ncbi:MAG: hypothetical protein EG823_08445 [Actinobacteria bacterium]|nr:hypothetical protein [Actinomycetota bacterium]